MDLLERMNSAIDYIEENISDEIDYVKVSQIACCSAYNFQRMFSFITNVTLSEYIRRRRLTIAAYELQNSKIKIIDLAIKYGYDSHESFSRSFQKLHGIPPSIARKKGIVLKAYSRISFQITIKGDVEMRYRIEEGQATKVFGKSIVVTYADEKCFSDIEEFVAQSWKNGLREKIRFAAGYGSEDDKNAKLLGIALHGFKEDGTFKFMINAEYPKGGVSGDFEILEIPKATWAVFSTNCKHDEELDTMNKIWKRLPEWFQSTGFDHSSGIPELEKCYKTEYGYLAEVWIPIINKI